jgi:hypothetical protein
VKRPISPRVLPFSTARARVTLSAAGLRRAAGLARGAGPVSMLLLASGCLYLAACASSGFSPPSRPGQARAMKAEEAGARPLAAAPLPAPSATSDLNKAALDMRQLLDRVDAGTWQTPGGATQQIARDAGLPPVEPTQPEAAPATAEPEASATSVDTNEPIGETAEGTAPGQAHDTASKSSSENSPAAQPANESPQSRRDRLIGELAQALQDQARAEGAGAMGTDPLREGIRLLALDMIHPGGVEPELRAAMQAASPPEARTLQTLREMFRRLAPEAAPGDVTPPPIDPRAVSRVLSEHAADLGSQQPMAIAQAVLCTSVESFGRYTPFASNVFMQGTSHTAILYVAVENFAQRDLSGASDGAGGRSSGATEGAGKRRTGAPSKKAPTLRGFKAAIGAMFDSGPTPAAMTQDDGVDWAVDLGESISLFHDSDNLEVWNRPEEGVRDVAREKRADYYLVRRVQLPATLSLGRYNLKVTVRDRQSGASAEATIPIDIVGDPALTRSLDRR